MSLVLWGGGALALPLAWLVRHPLLLQWRPVAMPGLLIASMAALCLLCWQWRRFAVPPGQRRLLLALWLTVLGLACEREASFRWHQYQVLSATDAETQALGAHLIVGYNDLPQLKVLVQRGLVGGIFIGANNVQGRSAAAIRVAIAELQSLRQTAGLAPLIVSTDQEGGLVSRMSPPLPRLAPLAEVIAGAPQDAIESLAFAYGAQHGQELAALGVNINFAPLADLSMPNTHHRMDFRSLIERRAIDADPQRVRAAVVGYAHGLEAQGVHATLKHFPGLGRVTQDTHLFSAPLAASEGELETSDWIPFREGLRATQSLLMVGHATLSAVDASQPASLSHKVVQGIVRERWGHEGILVTDDLAMAPVVQHGLCAAGVDAINAGVDLLLVSYDTDQYYEVMHCLLQAQRQGRLHTLALNASQRRLHKLQDSLRAMATPRVADSRHPADAEMRTVSSQ